MKKVDNSTSSTFHDIGPNDYQLTFPFPGDINIGDYAVDTVRIPGPSSAPMANVTIVLAEGPTPANVLRFGFPSQEKGLLLGTFPQYPTLAQTMVQAGIIESATYSMYLNPSQGRSQHGQLAFPPADMLFGAVDTGLFVEPLVTMAVLESNETTVAPKGKASFYTIALSDIRLQEQHSAGLLQSPISCVVDVSGMTLSVPTDAFTSLVASFPDPVFNETLGIYHVDCHLRDEPRFNLSITLLSTDSHNSSLTLEIPSSNVIWPSSRVATGGDPDTCAIAINPGSEERQCIIGTSVMKSAYIVFDVINQQISFAVARPSRSPLGKLVKIPAEGVRGIKECLYV